MSLSRCIQSNTIRLRVCDHRFLPNALIHTGNVNKLQITRSCQADAPSGEEKVGFFTKIKCRFQGVPIKGELHAPISIMRDIDKVFVPHALPEMPKDFKEHPERDLVNYPFPAKQMYAPKLRLMIIPDKFMNAFHKYTGTSGPYVFLGMLYTFLHCKGYFEIAHDRVKVLVVLAYFYIFSRAFNYRWDKFFYEHMKKFEQRYKNIIAEDFRSVKEVQETSQASKAAFTEIKKLYPEIFKENMLLQLEATYRANIETLAGEMKRRLSYLQETEAVKQAFVRQHMLNWIIQSVLDEITQNKDNIKDRYVDSCIDNLKGISLQS